MILQNDSWVDPDLTSVHRFLTWIALATSLFSPQSSQKMLSGQTTIWTETGGKWEQARISQRLSTYVSHWDVHTLKTALSIVHSKSLLPSSLWPTIKVQGFRNVVKSHPISPPKNTTPATDAQRFFTPLSIVTFLWLNLEWNRTWHMTLLGTRINTLKILMLAFAI